jgi:hypothetical protein
MRFTTTTLTILLAFGAGCDGCGDDDAESAEAEERALDPASIEVPSDLLMEACAGADRAAIQEALGPAGSAALFAADTRAALAEVSEQVAPYSSDVEPRAPLCALSFRSADPEDSSRIVVAPIARPIEGGDEGAPGGGRWLAERVAVIGDALVVGTERSLIEHAGAYAALRALPAERETPIEVSVPEGVVAQRGRAEVNEAVRGWVRQGRATLAAERDAHERPPELGDPAAVLDHLQELGNLLIDALEDIGAMEATLGLEGSQLQLEVRAALRDGAPFTERARAWPQAVHGFQSLPEGTAFAYFRAGLPEGEETLAAVLQTVAGERLGLAEREALAGVAEAVHDKPRTIALGGNDQGPFVLWRSRGAELNAVGQPLREAFVAGYLATLASTASGCEGSGARLAGRATGRCPEAPVSALRGSTFVVAPEGQRLLLDDGPADPRIARVVGDEAPVVAALLIVPSALPGAVRLFKPAPPLGTVPPGGGLLVTLTVDDDGLVLRARAASDAFGILARLLDG